MGYIAKDAIKQVPPESMLKGFLSTKKQPFIPQSFPQEFLAIQ